MKQAIIIESLPQIIQVNLTQDNPQPIVAGRPLELTYSVKWVAVTTSFARRFDAYLDYPFFEHQVYYSVWLSAFLCFI